MLQKNKKSGKEIIVPVLLLVVLVVSVLFGMTIAGSAASPINRFAFQSLREKENTVLSLTAGSAVISTAISLIPGDVATPLANSFGSVTNYLVIALAAIFAEKYLVTLIGKAVFCFVIPACCVFGLLYCAVRRRAFRDVAIKIGIISLCMYGMIPCSELLTRTIWNSYDANIQETMNDFLGDSESIVSGSQELETNQEEEQEKDWKTVWSETWQKGVEFVQKTMNTISADASELLKKAQNALNNFIEAAAIMIVTSCVFPILIFLVMKWIINLVIQLDFDKAISSMKKDGD